MDLVLEAKYNRLKKMYQENEFHGWLIKDHCTENKIHKNLITGEDKEVTYITKDNLNPLPFHREIEYVGIIHTKILQEHKTIECF